MSDLRHLLLICFGVWAAADAGGTTVVPPDFAQLVNGSDYVVRARVAKVTAEPRTVEGRALIFTRVEFEVLAVLAGAPPRNLVLVMLGGKLGDEELWIGGAPRFAAGDEDILFVSGNGANLHPLYALGHGRYPVRRDAAGREFVARSNGVPLTGVAEVALPLAEEPPGAGPGPRGAAGRALTPAEFAAAIKQTRASSLREK
ncbi:MAG: hypothetical protein HY302_00105 [Opitutae bacterium]|nr:hypothetical protein [Opitutae bacterium]